MFASRSSSDRLEPILLVGVIREGLEVGGRVTLRLVGGGCLSESPAARAGYQRRRSRRPQGWSSVKPSVGGR